MQLPKGWPPTAASDTIESLNPDNHFLPLKDAIPDWLGQVSPVRRQALQNTQPQLLDRLKMAPAAQHQALKALNATHLTAQSEVDQRLEHLQDANAFAEPLLKAALKKRFGLDLDVRTTFLRLYVPATIPLFPVKTGARAWTVSLLDAALHNFEAKETRHDAYETDSTYITQPSATGQFDTLPLIKNRMSIPAFTQLCRELDIGAQYSRYLDRNFGLSVPADAKALRLKIDASQQAALKAALQWAQMNRDISQSYFRLISGLLDGLPGLRINGQAVLCHDVTMMSAPLTGLIVFSPDLDQAHKTARIVAYVPDDPEHPIKEYASALEMVIELTRQLRSKDYQRFFSRFVNHEQRGFFFAGLNERLSKVTWHPPVAGSSEPTWRETPLDRPNLQTAFTPIKDNLWQHLYQAKLNKILNDARAIAVPTATVDQRTRWALWDSLVNIASSILQTAAFIIAPFVPVLGEAMMAYMAYQLLDEAFEGIVEWAQGQTREAFEHFMGTVESLVQLGAFAIGGAIGASEYRKVLPKEIVAFIDRFKPVELPNGQTRYWEPDLARYEQKSLPGPASTPTELGLHQHQGQHLLPLEGAHFAVSEGPIPGEYRIEHPSRPEAYKPLLRHNGDGAWHTELEQPLEWDKQTALRRIGSSVESFTPEQRETILQVSGYNEDALRKMHVDQQPLPPLLADTIKRFKIDQDLKRFIDQLDSERPEQYLSADPLLQLQLLNESGRWPANKRLSFMDQQGEVIWQSSADDTLPLTEIRQDNLLDGDLLKTLLLSLEDSEIKALQGEEFGGPTRPVDVSLRTLRKWLVDLAWQQRTTLFESRYQALERIDNPLAQTITQYDPQLPLSITRELLNTATGDELVQLSEGQLPPRQQALMQQASQEVRVTRAFEGLELDSVNNPDSDTLALHSLKGLPGWSGDVRIEIRDRHYEGPMLDSTGRIDAAIQKVLVRQTDGTYQPYDNRGQELHSTTDFYSSLIYALPDAERKSLNIQIGQRDTLKAAIRQRTLERSELRVRMSAASKEEPVVDTLRLLGAEGYPRMPTPPHTLERDIQALYPRMSDQEIDDLAQRMRLSPQGPRAELVRLQNQYLQLQNDLQIWANSPPATHPVTRTALTSAQRTAEIQNRRLLRNELLKGWRRESGTFDEHLGSPSGTTIRIEQPVLGDLPSLSADFSHVAHLYMQGNDALNAPDGFLGCFTGLRGLELRGFALGRLPVALTRMQSLESLMLSSCGVELNAAGQATLSTLHHLKSLDLYNNSLGTVPDVTSLRALVFLDLSRTGIDGIPVGLARLPKLETALLNENAIVALPDNVVEYVRRGVDLSTNPLSTASRDRIKAVYQFSYADLGVWVDQEDLDLVRTLYPAISNADANRLVYRLPGKLADGHVELLRRQTELAALLSELEAWVKEVPRNPVSQAALEGETLLRESANRARFKDDLEQHLRKSPIKLLATEFICDLSFTGELPKMTGRFDQISKLTLTSTSNMPPRVDRVLELFPNLVDLEIRAYQLTEIPAAVFSMRKLKSLSLPDCRIMLTQPAADAIGAMENLQSLDLSNNPLGIPPDLSNLRDCRTLNLRNTGLTKIPAGLLDLPYLKYAHLSDNAITELPVQLLSRPDGMTTGFDFSGNPLSAASQQRLATFNAANEARLSEERLRWERLNRALDNFEDDTFSD
jgi:Leucine-rich repeat (LRR) protein